VLPMSSVMSLAIFTVVFSSSVSLVVGQI